jgi:uncharacterized protein
VTPDLDSKIVDQIVKLLVAAAQPQRIILFGSYARGEQTPDSDLDLLVTEDVVPDPAREQVRLRRVLGDIDLPIDVLVLSEHDLTPRQRWLGTAIYDALQDEKQLYAAEQHR